MAEAPTLAVRHLTTATTHVQEATAAIMALMTAHRIPGQGLLIIIAGLHKEVTPAIAGQARAVDLEDIITDLVQAVDLEATTLPAAEAAVAVATFLQAHEVAAEVAAPVHHLHQDEEIIKIRNL